MIYVLLLHACTHVQILHNLISMVHCISAALGKYTDREGEGQSYRDCIETNKVTSPELCQSPSMTLLRVAHFRICLVSH